MQSPCCSGTSWGVLPCPLQTPTSFKALSSLLLSLTYDASAKLLLNFGLCSQNPCAYYGFRLITGVRAHIRVHICVHMYICMHIYELLPWKRRRPLPFNTSPMMMTLKCILMQMEKSYLYRHLIPSGTILFLIIYRKIKIIKRQQIPVRTRRLICLPAVPSIRHIQLPQEADHNEGCAASRYIVGTPLSFYL